MTPEQAMQEAIRIAGGAAALSREIGISSQAISQWNVVPAARVMAVVKAAGGKVSVNQLRPDIFGERPAA
ncbi:hypothetical protein TW86_13500 [Halomonas sp. S2151]|uniref:Cro/CI family transcriptional regulator n=1 Tax=Halomonas sp. S2151 TaxID=579478 RepID=UPI0005F9F6F3|nr:Cro/CI family transcriptional regulator [Halomonas sp. S2151]KJZ10899.1 hypothetical protein TW86_13500 [Halomonas sp. S2151]